MASLSRFIPEPKTAAIVGCPFSGGQPKAGVDEGPIRIVEAGIIPQLEDLGWKVKFDGHHEFENISASLTSDPPIGKLKNPRLVSQVTEAVAKAVGAHVQNGELPVTIGGDHSLAMGTISGTLSHYPNACVVWVDAHADINTVETTDSGNIHGMPVSFLLGIGSKVPEFSWVKPLLKADSIVYIGLRDVDAGEKQILREHNIKAFSMHEVDRYGIGKVVEMALDHVNPKRDRPIHLSFDVDALDPSVAPSTGTPVRGGLTFREGHYICEAVYETGLLVALDLMEVNPSLKDPVDVEQTVTVGCSLLRSALALRIRPPTNQDSTSIPARFQRSVIQATSSTSVAIEPASASLANAGAPSVSSGPGAAKKQAFTFDQVHGPPTTQYEMFESTAKPLISRFLEGFNCTILAYGQTSSGKTFTMTGVDLDADPTDPSTGMGIVPRAVSNIFSRANQLKEEKHGMWTYNIKASFIEIYNEDLIDLLSMDEGGGARREVQIREDKDGHIIWGGLREVNVRNANEVMGLIRKGTSIRRTNETDMNAQSSRSHAIFSLTLTQKKYSGSGPPPRSSSPLPPGGRSPSRLARPGSMYAGPGGARVSSPTGGRPSTPSFASAMHRGGLRPASALGHSGDRPADDDSGEWVTITSKFHFVDLAGSERLKRTAAQGERIKEGISINSGLLALGNVISALGDPARAKSNTASYVPYRDSKLTRLLQDSLGGNAHTLMIACVSPAEWNAGETLNTLKYANRARNIKNRAVVNEKEEGWDDVEWLQGTVSRLRKELKALKDGGALPAVEREGDVVEGASKKVLFQLGELQNNYEDLREKFVERTEELTRLRGELGEKHRQSNGGSIGGTAKYEEIVGPVIEEYEKTISAMEAELSLNRAALRHTNELVEEKEEELSAIHERHSATEMYVEELRSRVSKLSEREASNEAYIRDLEEKMKSYDETTMSSSESMSDLRKEVHRYKEAEAYSGKYIADLEARLAKCDESIITLQQSVEKLEHECERRQQEVESLQGRLEAFKQDGEGWLTNLEEREQKVKALEEKMAEWEKKKEEANEARARLGEVVDEVVSARRSLQLDLAKLPAHPIVTAPSPISESPPSEAMTPSPAPDLNSTGLESQLLALQQTHTATLADLSSVTAKYRDALREISDLAAQIQEAKLINSTPAESVISESPSPVNEKPAETPSRRRMTGGRSRESSDAQLNTPGGRRLFFPPGGLDGITSREVAFTIAVAIAGALLGALAQSFILEPRDK
ncbi:hypothetical protein H1R20_g9347, partial [Candolleomyces eurysporus]